MSSPFFRDIPDPRPPRQVRVLTPAMKLEMEKVRIQNLAVRARDRAWVRWVTTVFAALAFQLLIVAGVEPGWVMFVTWIGAATVAWQLQDRWIKATLKTDMARYHLVDGDSDGDV